MELRQLANFVRVVEAGSLVRAAAITGLSQPTLSREVASLEEEFGQRLLVRTGRGVLPTEAGVALLAHARAILELADRATAQMRAMDASPRGKVVVGLPPHLARKLAAPLVKKFRDRFPDALLSVVEGLSVNLREWLIAGRLDLALMVDPRPSPQLDYEPLASEDMVLLVPAGWDHIPAQVGVRALDKYPMVLPSVTNTLRDLIESALRVVNVRLDVIAEVDAIRTLPSLVEDGSGCSVLPRSAASEADAARVRVVEIGWPPIRSSLVLAQPHARPSTRLMREVVKLLRGLDFLGAGAVDPAGPPQVVT